MTVPPAWDPTPEALLAERAWAERLARRLVRDAALAEDLAQEATLRALERAPRNGLRAWLGGVVRNLAQQGRRERGRRARREELAARPEALPSAADALQRLAVQQDVVRAVLGLTEPYRSTVVLRFYEGLPPRAIAARQGLPVATVKTRLARGLALLREQLDGEHGGDGRAWALFLLPLAERPIPLPPLLAGALAVNAIPKLFAAATVTVGVVFWVATRENLPRALPEEAAFAGSSAELRAPRVLPEEARPVEPRREAAPAALPPLTKAPAPTAEVPTITGRVLDAEGLPVPGVELAVRGSSGVRLDAELASSILWDEELPVSRAPLAISGVDGRFSLARPETFSGYVVSQDARWETVLGAGCGAEDAERIVVVAPRFRLRGRVVDIDGAPLAGVEFAFVVPRERLRLVGLSLEASRSAGWMTSSDSDGRFAFERLPSVDSASLHARLDPFEPYALVREAWHDDELEIVLVEPAGDWLVGRVESAGRPLADATVTLGYQAVQSAADGSFRFSLAGLETERELCALAPHLLPARMSGDVDEDGRVRWPSFVRLVLAGETLSLAGQVVDEHGAPLADQEVWLEDPSIAFVQGQGFAFVLEALLAGHANMRHGTKTDGHGRFELGGLEERDYTLRVIDPTTALLVDHGPFGAGARDLRLVRPDGASWPRLKGVVRSRSGTPLAGLRVSIDRQAGVVGVHDRYFSFVAYGSSTSTAADGSFELVNVPRGGVTLHVNGTGIADPELELGPLLDPEALEVTVASSVQLLVRLGSLDSGATHVAVLDAAGASLDLTVPMEGGTRRSRSIALQGTESPVIRLSDDGVTLLLLDREGAELARAPLALQPGRINTIEL